jgi:hypothetical protein
MDEDLENRVIEVIPVESSLCQDSRFRSGTPQRILTTQVLRWQSLRFVNSRDLSPTDFHLEEVRPLHLDVVTRGDRRMRGTAVRKLQGVGNSTFVLSVENDNDFRSRCE